MIVTGQMNHPVQDQHPELGDQSARVTPCISPRGFWRNYHIPYILVGAPFPRLPNRTCPTSFSPPSGKGKHVGRSLLSSKVAIHPRHGQIAHETDADAFFGEAKFALHAIGEPG